MAVPAHDDRDYEFAIKFNLPIKKVIKGGEKDECYLGGGTMINCNKYDGIKNIEFKSYSIYIYVIIISIITNNIIIIRLQRPESGCVVLALACVGVCVVRPFPGGRHSHAARRAG